jgi:predicted dehydrogenase
VSGSGPVGVGVIGAGVISTQYLTNLTAFPDLRVLFVADLDVDRAEEQAQSFGVPAWGTVGQLLARDDIEIVVNLTIPAAHVDVALQALDAGKHVWIEKPIALDLVSGRQLLHAAQTNRLRVAAAPDTFLGAGLQTAQRVIERGDIGRPLTGLALFQSGGAESWHPNPQFLYAKGAGPLFDIGPYYITALVQNLGAVDRVAAVSSKARDTRTIATGPNAGIEFPVDVPTHLGGILRFESGSSAQGIWSNESSQTRVGFIEINGTDGTLVFSDPNRFDGQLTLWRRGAEAAETISATGSTFTRGTGVLEFARAIRVDRHEAASGELAYHVLDVMVALDTAADTGDWQKVESTISPRPALPENWDPSEATL